MVIICYSKKNQTYSYNMNTMDIEVMFSVKFRVNIEWYFGCNNARNGDENKISFWLDVLWKQVVKFLVVNDELKPTVLPTSIHFFDLWIVVVHCFLVRSAFCCSKSEKWGKEIIFGLFPLIHFRHIHRVRILFHCLWVVIKCVAHSIFIKCCLKSQKLKSTRIR